MPNRRAKEIRSRVANFGEKPPQRSSSSEHAEVDSLEHGTSLGEPYPIHPVSTKAQSRARRLDFAWFADLTQQRLLLLLAFFLSRKLSRGELGDQRSLLSGEHIIYFILCRRARQSRTLREKILISLPCSSSQRGERLL
jgi:hypothetical protein